MPPRASGSNALDASAAGNIPSFSVTPQYRFNPSLDYKVFMVPALLVLLLTLVCGLLPALNIVGEGVIPFLLEEGHVFDR